MKEKPNWQVALKSALFPSTGILKHFIASHLSRSGLLILIVQGKFIWGSKVVWGSIADILISVEK